MAGDPIDVAKAGRLLQRLVEHGVDFVLIGGVAALMHGSTMVTRDVDVCIRLDGQTLDRLSRALEDLHPTHRITPQRIPFRVAGENLQGLKNLYLETDWGVLDCLGDVAGIGNFDQAVAASLLAQLPFGTCKVLSIESLIRAKEATARPNDLQTVVQLKCIAKRNATG